MKHNDHFFAAVSFEELRGEKMSTSKNVQVLFLLGFSKPVEVLIARRRLSTDSVLTSLHRLRVDHCRDANWEGISVQVMTGS